MARAGVAAQQYARKLVQLAEVASRREGCDVVTVTTAELCKAMGTPGGATMEEVKSFVVEVLKDLCDRGMTGACGCGFLALRLMRARAMDEALAQGRDLREFTPADIDGYLSQAES